MTNLEKLLKFLVKENDYKELTLKSGLEETTVKKFTMDVFARIIPSNFNKVEGSHIDETDLISIVNNFNDLVKEDNLKQLITNSVSKYNIGVKDASNLLMALLPVIHKNIQIIAAPRKAQETKVEKAEEEKKEADKIYDNIASKAQEETVVKQEEVKDAITLKREAKEKAKQEKLAAKAKAKEEKANLVQDGQDEKLSTLEKVCIYIILACLALLLVSFVVVLIIM